MTTEISEQDYGLLPDIWGPHAWEFLHSVSFGYPINPTKEDKIQYEHFFRSLEYVLPCGCKKSYGQFIASDVLLDDNVFKDRDSLTKWVYDLHERVNKKLGKTYNVTYEEIYKKYNSYRTKDDMDSNDKAKCHEVACKKEVPYFDINIARKITQYAIKRGLKDFKKNIEKKYKIKKETTKWDKRTEHCRNLIKEMKVSAIDNIEKVGEFKNLPTVDELHLMENLCTTISLDIIQKIVKILENDIDATISENLADEQGRCTECTKPDSKKEVNQSGGYKKKYVFFKN